jgi:hypothetical protein
MRRRFTPLWLAWLLLLGACSIDEDLGIVRPWVEIVPVESFIPCCVEERPIRARVVQPFAIHVLRGLERDVDLIAHELVHVMQWQRHGAAFPILYLEQIARHGYRDAPFEVEARTMASTRYYQAWALYLIARLPSDLPAQGAVP